MKKPLHTVLCLLALACMSAQPARAWQIEKHTDEMTDAIYYAIYTTGTVVNVKGLFNYTPQLQLRIHPVKYFPEKDALYFKADVLVGIESEGFPRRNPQIMTRIDDAEPVTSVWKPSTDRRAVFSPEPLALLDQLKPSTTFRVRYATTLGDIRTTRFSTSGITNEITKVKALYKATLAP